MTSLLQQLSEAFGVSGHEQEVRDILYEAIRAEADEISVDTMGNLIALKKARKPVPDGGLMRVMIAAHMDEIGFMVTGIESNGFLRFAPVGGIDPRVVVGKQVMVGEDRMPGVIGSKPIHLQDRTGEKQVFKFDQLMIDVGANGKDDLEGKLKVGDYATFAMSYRELDTAPDGLRTVMGKALDDRAGCALLVELLRGDYDFDLYAAFTVQEEVGLRGAGVAAYAIKPQLAFVLETTVCDDLPKEEDVTDVTRLGAGPAITIMDKSVVADKRLVQLLVDTAEREGIPYQFKSPGMGGTDAGAIHLAREGIPSAVVSTPCRYLHSMANLLSLRDYEQALRLMQATLQGLTPDVLAHHRGPKHTSL